MILCTTKSNISTEPYLHQVIIPSQSSIAHMWTTIKHKGISRRKKYQKINYAKLLAKAAKLLGLVNQQMKKQEQEDHVLLVTCSRITQNSLSDRLIHGFQMQVYGWHVSFVQYSKSFTQMLHSSFLYPYQLLRRPTEHCGGKVYSSNKTESNIDQQHVTKTYTWFWRTGSKRLQLVQYSELNRGVRGHGDTTAMKH